MPLNNHYKKNLKPYARKLRKGSTTSEVIVWSKLLRARNMMGYQFLRQRPIDRYLVDFFCKELMLIIEVDGLTHTFEETFEYHAVRQKELENLGYSILRFSDSEIQQDVINVYRTITGFIEEFEEKNPEILQLNGRKITSGRKHRKKS